MKPTQARMPVLPLDRHLYLTVRPAALEPRAAVSGIIVGHYVQDVLPRLGECGCRRRLAGKHAVNIFAVYSFDFGPVFGECHIAWPAVLRPSHRHWRTQVSGPRAG